MLLYQIFFASALLQLLFFLVVYTRLIFYRKPETNSSASPEPVSVVVCEHNELENLKHLLPRLYQQDYDDYEIVIVNDRSDDGSLPWLQQQAEIYKNFKLVSIRQTPENFNSKKYALTQGIAAARNDIIVLTDADCSPENDRWLYSMAEKLREEKQIIIGYSPYLKASGWLNGFVRFETLLTAIQYFSFALWGNPYMGVGRNLAYRRSFFESKNGFEGYEKVTGGDDDIFVNKHADKRNTAIAIGVDALVWSRPKSSIKSYFRQKKRHLAVGKYYTLGDKIKLGLFSLSHIIFWSSLVSLGLVGDLNVSVLAMLLLRTLSLYLVFFFCARKLGDQINLGTLLFWDFIYAFYYLITGITAATAKNIKWG